MRKTNDDIRKNEDDIRENEDDIRKNEDDIFLTEDLVKNLVAYSACRILVDGSCRKIISRRY